jgi:uncharacterized protein YbcV (DUF1398 family)
MNFEKFVRFISRKESEKNIRIILTNNEELIQEERDMYAELACIEQSILQKEEDEKTLQPVLRKLGARQKEFNSKLSEVLQQIIQKYLVN